MAKTMDKVLRKKIDAFYVKHGRHDAEVRLRDAGLSKSMAQKLLAGTYLHQPEGLYLNALNKALEAK